MSVDTGFTVYGHQNGHQPVGRTFIEDGQCFVEWKGQTEHEKVRWTKSQLDRAEAVMSQLDILAKRRGIVILLLTKKENYPPLARDFWFQARLSEVKVGSEKWHVVKIKETRFLTTTMKCLN